MSREQKSEALNRLVVAQNVSAAHEAGSGYLRLPLRTIEEVKAERAKVSS